MHRITQPWIDINFARISAPDDVEQVIDDMAKAFVGDFDVARRGTLFPMSGTRPPQGMPDPAVRRKAVHAAPRKATFRASPCARTATASRARALQV